MRASPPHPNFPFVTDPLSQPTIPETPRKTLGAWIMAVVLFILTLALDTRHNDFPFTYHPDEGGKVVQPQLPSPTVALADDGICGAAGVHSA